MRSKPPSRAYSTMVRAGSPSSTSCATRLELNRPAKKASSQVLACCCISAPRSMALEYAITSGAVYGVNGGLTTCKKTSSQWKWRARASAYCAEPIQRGENSTGTRILDNSAMARTLASLYDHSRKPAVPRELAARVIGDPRYSIGALYPSRQCACSLGSPRGGTNTTVM